MSKGRNTEAQKSEVLQGTLDLLPALRFSRPDLNVSLKEGGGGSGFHGRGLRSALMLSEVALAVMLLVSAGLLIRSFIKLTGVDPLFFYLTFFCPLRLDAGIAAFQTSIKWGTIRGAILNTTRNRSLRSYVRSDKARWEASAPA